MNQFSLIVAIDSKDGIAKDKNIPWHYKEDLQYFKKITENSICIMGRNTYAEILKKVVPSNNKLLPNRDSYVLSRDENAVIQYATKMPSIQKSVNDINSKYTDKNVFFIGGVSIFEECVRYCVNTIYLTKINRDYNCDEFFNMKLLNDFILTNQIVGGETELIFRKYIRVR